MKRNLRCEYCGKDLNGLKQCYVQTGISKKYYCYTKWKRRSYNTATFCNHQEMKKYYKQEGDRR